MNAHSGAPAPRSIETVRRDLVAANHILARQKVVDTFGHVSERSPQRPDRVLIARSIAPARVTMADIVEIDLDGRSVDPAAPGSYLERFIHTEIYRSRPELQAIVHSHSPSVLPFSVAPQTPLRCVCHTAGFIGRHVPIFEVRDVGGDATDLLVSDQRLGAALAVALGGHSIVLMRGHGSTVVGSSLRQAVFRSVYAEINARVQLNAMQLGPITYLTDGEALVATSTDVAYDRAWDLWSSEVAPAIAGNPS